MHPAGEANGNPRHGKMVPYGARISGPLRPRFDIQPFWGKRVKALGVGPEPIPRKKLTADKLAHAIRVAVTHPRIKQRAAALGEAIRAEDGVGNAVNIVKQYLGA
jgi:sterol 3beta-glucosyltransferase